MNDARNTDRTETTMDTKRSEAIERLQTRRAIYMARKTEDAGRGFSADLWDDEIRDCDIMIARISAGLDLTPHQRGLV